MLSKSPATVSDVQCAVVEGIPTSNMTSRVAHITTRLIPIDSAIRSLRAAARSGTCVSCRKSHR